ncbi:MAG: PDZ domain-containing protein [Luteibacter sp.]
MTDTHGFRLRPSLVVALALALSSIDIGAADAPAPLDHPFRGRIELSVDATDTMQKIFRVHEIIPVQASGPVTLLYPEWELSSHSRTVSAANLAGLTIRIDGKDVPWTRDAIDMHAFHIDAPPGATSIQIDLQYVTRVDDALIRDDFVNVSWQHLLVYPAGWFSRNIPVQASVKVPDGLAIASGLSPASAEGQTTRFAPTSLASLLDTPAFAARHMRRIPIGEKGGPALQMDVIATDPADLVDAPGVLEHLRTLVAETRAVMGHAPYAHFDALVILSDAFPTGGIEHANSAEIYLPARYLRDPASQLNNLDLIAHEHVHAWNGRWRQPADLWVPTPNVPSRNSLLWVYEGQTEFWGRILAARSGMRTVEQTRDKLALDAAAVQVRAGRDWKSLADTTNDPLYVSGRSTVWPTWQRRKDYYGEGVLLWLDVDATLQTMTHGKVGIDDVAKAFFTTHGEPGSVSTYTFDDVCTVLEHLAPMDWKTHLDDRLAAKDARVLDGLERLGWKLAYTGQPSDTFLQDQQEGGATNLSYSLGLEVDDKGRVRTVVWNSPAFKAGMAPGETITQVNGQAFSTATLLAAVASSPRQPVTLTFELDGKNHTAALDYRDGPRYPSLARVPGSPDYLSALLKARSRHGS